MTCITRKIVFDFYNSSVHLIIKYILLAFCFWFMEHEFNMSRIRIMTKTSKYTTAPVWNSPYKLLFNVLCAKLYNENYNNNMYEKL